MIENPDSRPSLDEMGRGLPPAKHHPESFAGHIEQLGAMALGVRQKRGRVSPVVAIAGFVLVGLIAETILGVWLLQNTR